MSTGVSPALYNSTQSATKSPLVWISLILILPVFEGFWLVDDGTSVGFGSSSSTPQGAALASPLDFAEDILKSLLASE